MLKLLASSSVLVAFLCGFALAEPKTTTTYLVEYASKTGKHTILVTDHSCGEIELKSPQRTSFLKVCAETFDDGKHVRLGVERRMRDNNDESRQSAVVVASAGASYDLLDGKMTLKTR